MIFETRSLIMLLKKTYIFMFFLAPRCIFLQIWVVNKTKYVTQQAIYRTLFWVVLQSPSHIIKKRPFTKEIYSCYSKSLPDCSHQGLERLLETVAACQFSSV